MRIRVVLGVIALWTAMPCAAETPPPEASQADLTDVRQHFREPIKAFDFELEVRLGEPEPLYWSKVRGRGYPAYTRGRFDTGSTPTDGTSFCFQMNGGDCAYEYEPMRLAINTAYDYCIEGWIRTEGLRSSRATLGIWLNDQQGRAIQGTKVTTEPLGGDLPWTRVERFISSVGTIPGQPPARFLGLSMEVRGETAQDIGAKVWFDNITIYRIPRLRLDLTDGRILYEKGEAVTLHLRADGLLSGSFPGRLAVRDDRGRPVMDRVASLVPGPQGDGRRDVELKDLPVGVYHVAYDVPGDTPSVLMRRVSFAVMAPRQSPSHLVGNGFGLADPTGIDDPDLLARIVGALGVRTVKIPLWRADTSADDLRLGDETVRRVLRLMRQQHIECVGVLAEPPRHLLQDVHDPITGMADLLGLQESVWQPSLGFTVSDYGGLFSLWQLGRDDDPSTVRLQTDPTLLDAAVKQMDRLTAATPVGVPWPALRGPPRVFPQGIDFLSLCIGPEIQPHQIQECLAGFQAAEGTRVYLAIDPIARSQHAADDVVFDFVQRVLAAKRVGADTAFFHRLVDAETGLMRSPTEPSELLLVARTLTDMLGGATFAGWLPLENHVEAMVFQRDDGSETLVLWKQGERQPVQMPLYLGDGLMQTDLLGNRTPLPHFGAVTGVTLQPMPVFITGIDPQISRTRRSFRLRGGSLPAAYRRHQVEVEFTNCFNRPISGHLRLAMPRGWVADRTIIKFQLAQGEQLVQPLTIVVPYNETVGRKEILADFTVESKSTYRFLAVAPVDFQMATGRTRAVAFRDGANLVIEQDIECTASQPTSFTACVQIPGRPMLSHYAARVPPGQTIVRRYVLPWSPSFNGASALVGIRDDTLDRGFANVLVPLGRGEQLAAADRPPAVAPEPAQPTAFQRFPNGM